MVLSDEHRPTAWREYSDRIRCEQLQQLYTVKTLDRSRNSIIPGVNQHAHAKADCIVMDRYFERNLLFDWNMDALPQFEHICFDYFQYTPTTSVSEYAFLHVMLRY